MAKCISFQMDIGRRFLLYEISFQFSKKCMEKGRFKIYRKERSFDKIEKNSFGTHYVKEVTEKV